MRCRRPPPTSISNSWGGAPRKAARKSSSATTAPAFPRTFAKEYSNLSLPLAPAATVSVSRSSSPWSRRISEPSAWSIPASVPPSLLIYLQRKEHEQVDRIGVDGRGRRSVARSIARYVALGGNNGRGRKRCGDGAANPRDRRNRTDHFRCPNAGPERV